jgi:hypothetical protein
MRQQFLVIFILMTVCSYAQTFTKAKRFASAGFDDIVHIKTDKEGSHYIYGYYNITLNYTDSSGIVRTLPGFGLRDIFVAKLNCQLNTVWINRIGSTANDGGAFLFGSIAMDDSLNVYVAGTIGGNATFSSTGGPNSSLSSLGDDAFIVKYNNAGTLQWSVNMGSSMNDEAHKIVWDSDGFLYVAGGYRGNCAFRSNNGPTINRTSNGSVDIFLAKYTTNGVIDTVIVSGGSQDEILFDILPDNNGHLYVSGNTCCNNSPFNIGAYTVTNQASWGTFFFKISRNMQVSWLNVMGNANSENLGALAMADSGRFYIFGHFLSSVSLPSRPPGIAQNFTSAGNLDMLIGMYDTSGVLIAGKRFGGTGEEFASGLCVNRNFEPVITGRFSGTVNFDSKSLTSFGAGSNYFVHLNKNLVTQNALRAGGTSNDYSRTLSLGTNGEIVAAGNYTSPGTFGSLSLGTTLGNPDAFVTEINGINSTQILTAGNISGSTTIGCDSVLLKLNQSFKNVTYQWLRNNLPVTGANDSVLMAKLTGIYRVVIRGGACSSPDTSLPFTLNSNHVGTPSSINNTACFGNTINLNGTGTGNVQWIPTTGLSNPNILTPTLSVTGNAMYVLQKTAGNGCITSDTFNVTAENCCFTCATLPGTLGNGLVACYEFNGNANDGSGNNNHGTVVNATLTTDRFNRPNRAYYFNGTNARIQAPTAYSPIVTVTAWVQTHNNATTQIITRRNWTNAANEQFAFDTRGFHIKRNSNCVAGTGWQTLNYTSPPTQNVWEYLSVTFDGRFLRYYKNGILNSTSDLGVNQALDNCIASDLIIGATWQIFHFILQER